MFVPRLDKTQRAAITIPAVGLLVYQNGPDSSGFYYYDGCKWNWLLGTGAVDTTAWLLRGNLGISFDQRNASKMPKFYEDK